MYKFTVGVLAMTVTATLGTWQYLSAQEQGLAGLSPTQLRGYFTHVPWDGGTHSDASFQTLAGLTIPMFSYSVTSTKDNTARTGTMVGTSPFTTPLAGTTINAVIIPVRVIVGASIFDPTLPDLCDLSISTVSRFVSSPLVQNVPNLTMNGVNVGTTQWVNGFRRAEFWKQINGSSAYQNTISYRLALSSTVIAGSHGTTYSSGCTQLGIVSNTWLDNYLKNTLMPSLTASGVIGPTQFAIFLVRNVVQSVLDPPSISNCCILGYHGATGNPIQTYAVVSWDTTGDFGGVADGSISGHELGEWIDDPLGTNPTPAWGNIGQVSGCQTNLEVGDPLSGKLMPGYTLGGKTFHMQELAFFSWFFNKTGATSLGAGGTFSSNATFHGPSKVCPPGGTN